MEKFSYTSSGSSIDLLGESLNAKWNSHCVNCVMVCVEYEDFDKSVWAKNAVDLRI